MQSGTRGLAWGRVLVLVLATTVGGQASRTLAAEPSPVTPELRDRSVAAMREVFDKQERWVKIHAAEYLLGLDYPDGVREAFLKELDARGSEPEYRIGVWRVLARAANNEDEQKKWTAEICQVAIDPKSPDRLHAVETLAKLRYKAADDELKAIEQAAKDGETPMAA